MQYIWASRSPAKRMHIQAFDALGEPLLSNNGPYVSLCRSPLRFDRAINAPFKLGRKICKHCLARVNT